ncbi:uncharacterized protein LOC142570535 [Dermacentor variabilis]|uniref:uncharacterized protein LOC142570535 n=1 Tax=Dermacentor variabilis TaxID=34621 RepID=UPI003F5B6ACB
MTPLSALVGAVAGHMATGIPNEEDSDGAIYLPPVDNEPVRLLQPMITGEVEPTYDYYGIRSTGAQAIYETTNQWVMTNATSSPIVDDTAAAPELLDSNKENEPELAREATSQRPPRSRMALLEKTLASENEVRITLLREQHKLRMRLIQEEHADNLKKRNEEHKL